jgi:hypothetical protein
MSLARAHKRKEYGTDILTHDSQNTTETSNVRQNNTFKSSIMDQIPE